MIRNILTLLAVSAAGPVFAEQLYETKLFGSYVIGHKVDEGNDEVVFRPCPTYKLEDRPFDAKIEESKASNCPKTKRGTPAGFSVAPDSGTVDDIRQRGWINCAVSAGAPGFSDLSPTGEWQGMNADICRAVAAVILDDPSAVKFVPKTAKTRFTALASGEVDIMIPASPNEFGRATINGLEFVGPYFLTGQSFLVPRDLGVASATELDGATVCLSSPTDEFAFAEYFKTKGISYEPILRDGSDDALSYYSAGGCDVLTADTTALAITRSTLPDPGQHMILPETLTKEQIGPYVRDGDPVWADIIRFTVHALITAEELGITRANVDTILAGTDNAAIASLLGSQNNVGQKLGLDPGWASRAISATGNYGEIYARNVGEGTALNLERGMNALWSNGGLVYSPPMR